MAGSMKMRLVAGLAVVAVFLTMLEMFRLQADRRADLAVASLRSGREVSEMIGVDAPFEVQLARAGLLARSGRAEDAQELLVYLAERNAPGIGGLAAYNLGNLYLRRALAKVEAGEADQAIPMVSLAKEAYRKALALNPAHWDAKFNLEFAARMLPDIERSGHSADEPGEEGTNRLWTTLPGLPRGQP